MPLSALMLILQNGSGHPYFTHLSCSASSCLLLSLPVLSDHSFPVHFCCNLSRLVLFFYPAQFCSALFWSRALLLARVTPRRLIDPSGCRVDGKHMGSLHSTQKQLLEPSLPMENFYRTSCWNLAGQVLIQICATGLLLYWGLVLHRRVCVHRKCTICVYTFWMTNLWTCIAFKSVC